MTNYRRTKGSAFFRPLLEKPLFKQHHNTLKPITIQRRFQSLANLPHYEYIALQYNSITKSCSHPAPHSVAGVGTIVPFRYDLKSFFSFL